MPTPHEQSLANKFRQATDTFSGDWREGTFDWLKLNAAGALVKIDLAEQRLDATWKEARLDPAKEMAFDIALGLWKNAHVEALNEFKTRTGS